MGAVNTVHILIVLSAVAVLYAAWMMYFTMRESRRSEKDGKRGGTSPPTEKKRKGDIVGKSRFVLPSRRHSQPLTAIESENENGKENEDIFAQENVPQHPRQIAPAELDDVFGIPPEGEANDPLDLSYPLYEVKPFPEEEDAEEPDDDEDETDDSIRADKSYAQGASFEELGEAYRRVVHNPSMTDEQKEETGRILLDLKETDMYGIIISGKPEREDKVTVLIDTYLSAFHKRMSEGSAESQPPQGAVPPGFNVRDFV